MDLEFVGPPFHKGPLPAVFYFALSAEASLRQDPFNQPVTFLQKINPNMRIFSATIPFHELNPEKALHKWGDELNEGHDPITPFCTHLSEKIHQLYTDNIITKNCAAAGLSRGAFIACHLAAKQTLISTILGFAPLTSLQHIPSLGSAYAAKLDLSLLAPMIYNRTIRFYCGNRDIRVGTSYIFNFTTALAEYAYHQQIRSSPIELIIGPSIGHQGHGTPPHVFQAGAQWLAEILSQGLA